LLARTFGADRTLGALADTSGELLASGEVLFTRNVNLFIGELSGESTERVQRIARTIDDAGVRASVVPDIVSREWSKFVCWLGFFSLSLTTRVFTWRYLSDADSAVLLVRLVRELAALAKAQGIALTEDRALLPLRTVLDGSDEEAIAAVHKVGEQYRANAPGHRMSSLQDLLAGRPLEIEETFGYALRKARELKVPTPLLDTLYHIVRTIDRTRT
jgi:2-dehydropantoate 2-reductase